MPVRKFQLLMARRKGTAEEMAEALGVDRTTLYKWASGEELPGWQSLQSIYLYSNGRVTPNHFMPASTRRMMAYNKTIAKRQRHAKST